MEKVSPETGSGRDPHDTSNRRSRKSGLRGDLGIGDEATGVIRLEQTRIADGVGDNRVQTELITGMFLGDRRENLFKLGGLRLRCYGEPTIGGACWLEIPPEHLWIFARPREV